MKVRITSLGGMLSVGCRMALSSSGVSIRIDMDVGLTHLWRKPGLHGFFLFLFARLLVTLLERCASFISTPWPFINF